CDWRERPLSEEKVIYARSDSHYLIPLWYVLRERLLVVDTGEDPAAIANSDAVVSPGSAPETITKVTAPGATPPVETMDSSQTGLIDGVDPGSDAGLMGSVGSVKVVDGTEIAVSDLIATPPGKVAVSRGRFLHGSPAESAMTAEAAASVAALSGEEDEWAGEWDSPETWHKFVRSRSGSLYRSRLESIDE
ncbi:unnamed protein product, partial [Choristocarpus tenellus]